jgi:hypothetical protein
MKEGKLTVAQVFEILGQQARVGGLFGQIARQMGLLSQVELYDLLELQSQLTPTMTEALIALGTITPSQAQLVLEGVSSEASCVLFELVPE